MSKENPKNKNQERSEIEYCRIFPPIGIARIGNSPDEFFIGPEAPGPFIEPEGGYKDVNGRMKKQAARFRIYGFDKAGNCVGEITAEDAKIKWTVELANKKAEWFGFDGADNVIYTVENGKPKPFPENPDREKRRQLRNQSVKGSDRKNLSITPKPAKVSGVNKIAPPMAGRFLNYKDEISLGACRTDEEGRLLVLAGDGKADTVLNKDAAFLEDYANNDWWFDDTADGPVTADVSIDGVTVKVLGRAWVICAPPDFSPQTQNVVTLYDAFVQNAFDLSLDWPETEIGPKPGNSKPSFKDDILPILWRTSEYRWVSDRAKRAHGDGRVADYTSFESLSVLSDPKIAAKPGSPQSHVLAHVRNPNHTPGSIEARNEANLSFMPALSGDEGTIRLGDDSRWLKLTKHQYKILQRWSEGDFVGDFFKTKEEFREFISRSPQFNEIKEAHRPAALTRSAMEACEGGAFFPGIEITSIIRTKSFYCEAFRISDSYEPGDVTKWMALPWQADFNDCSDNWWPAVRPDEVIPEDYFLEVNESLGDGSTPASLMLTRREKWARDLGVKYTAFNFVDPPTLPTVVDGMSGAEYKAHAEATIQRFIRYFSWGIPSMRSGELPANYIRRVSAFLVQTIGTNGIDLSNISPGDIPEEVRKHVSDHLKLDDLKNRGAEKYRSDELSRLSSGVGSKNEDFRRIFTGVMDIVWRIQISVADKNEMVDAWSDLGVVTNRATKSGEQVLIETGRDRFARLPWRKMFYYLMNIEQYPEFLPKARELSEEYLQTARETMRTTSPLRRFFPYSREMFDARLEAIYEANRRGAEAYDPAINPGPFDTEEKIVERIRQLSPFNQLDGGWLQRVTPAGNATKVQALLFQIWMDELGNGDPAQNHANVYTDLMRSAGIYYPDVKTKDYAENPEIWDDMFSGPVYHTAISLFPETYYPELIGMTLYLEWEANDLQRMVDLYEYYGYSSLFYKLHVAIDNTVDGHGAMAKKIVELYLDEVRAESGESGVQEHWERIWTGYIAFALGGAQLWNFHLNNPKSPRQKVLELIEKKKHYGSLSHHDKKLGAARINALFEEPRMFLAELQSSDYIVPGNPDDSPFMKLLEPDGVMFRVFTTDEVEIWREWIRALPTPAPLSLDAGTAMVRLLNRMAAIGVGAIEHADYKLFGPDPLQEKKDWKTSDSSIEKTVSWWFQLLRRPPADGLDPDTHEIAFLRALANPENGWIVPQQPERSRFVTELLGDGAMGARLRDTRPLLGGIRGAEVIVNWIKEGCPDPVDPQPEVAEKQMQEKVFSAMIETPKGPDRYSNFSAMLEEVLPRRSSTTPAQSQTYFSQKTPGPGMGSVQ